MDIDKQYILGFSISDNGKLQTMSNLQNEDGVTIDMVMNLPKPNGVKYEESSESENKITLQELQAVTQILNPTLIPNIGGIQRSLEPLVRILNSGVNTIQFQQYPSNDPKARANYDRAKRKFIRMINKHSLTKLNDYMTEQALKNQVTQRALDITLDPRNQLNLQIPIVMTQIQTAAKKSTMGKKEKILNAFSPYAKYLLQYQNMVGKQVIGIAAVSLKVKFAVETYMNTLIDQMQQYLQQNDIDSALKVLGQIVIKHPLTKNITTLANINFEDVINYLTDLNITSVPVLVNNVPELLINYYSNGQFNIQQCLLNLQMNANATDSSETISELLSSATDSNDSRVCRIK